MSVPIDDCENCGGTGSESGDTCPVCHGTGHKPMNRTNRKPLYIS